LNLVSPGPGEYHGCPFKTYSEDNLRQLIASYNLKQEDVNSIVSKSRKENHHQVACLRLFEASHKGGVTDNVGNHPNGFFNSSVQYIKDVEKNNKRKEA
jgi:DNA primase large subunit